jgi:hypothetical protein
MKKLKWKKKNWVACSLCGNPIDADREVHIVGIADGKSVTLHTGMCRNMASVPLFYEHCVNAAATPNTNFDQQIEFGLIAQA